jgi:hypothetical protein
MLRRASSSRARVCSGRAAPPMIEAIVEFFLRSLFDHIATQSRRE